MFLNSAIDSNVAFIEGRMRGLRAAELRSITSGRGSFEVAFDHYAEVPHNEAQQVIAAARTSED